MKIYLLKILRKSFGFEYDEYIFTNKNFIEEITKIFILKYGKECKNMLEY